jgi:hypothetical protein
MINLIAGVLRKWDDFLNETRRDSVAVIACVDFRAVFDLQAGQCLVELLPDPRAGDRALFHSREGIGFCLQRMGRIRRPAYRIPPFSPFDITPFATPSS